MRIRAQHPLQCADPAVPGIGRPTTAFSVAAVEPARATVGHTVGVDVAVAGKEPAEYPRAHDSYHHVRECGAQERRRRQGLAKTQNTTSRLQLCVHAPQGPELTLLEKSMIILSTSHVCCDFPAFRNGFGVAALAVQSAAAAGRVCGGAQTAAAVATCTGAGGACALHASLFGGMRTGSLSRSRSEISGTTCTRREFFFDADMPYANRARCTPCTAAG